MIRSVQPEAVFIGDIRCLNGQRSGALDLQRLSRCSLMPAASVAVKSTVIVCCAGNGNGVVTDQHDGRVTGNIDRLRQMGVIQCQHFIFLIPRYAGKLRGQANAGIAHRISEPIAGNLCVLRPRRRRQQGQRHQQRQQHTGDPFLHAVCLLLISLRRQAHSRRPVLTPA